MEQLIVSCRSTPENTTSFCEYPYEVYDLFGTPVALVDMWARLAGRRVCVNVHGYRSPWASVVTASNELLMGHKHIDSKYDACVMFAWPGSWSVALGYVMSTYRAVEAGNRLRIFLERLAHYATCVDLQAHSLGARVSLIALNHHDATGVGTLALCAGAVDSTALWDEFANVTKRVHRVKVFYSANDSVLKSAYRQMPWNWFSAALGFVGPRPPGDAHPLWERIQAYNYTGIALGHSAYRDLPRFYVDLNA